MNDFLDRVHAPVPSDAVLLAAAEALVDEMRYRDRIVAWCRARKGEDVLYTAPELRQ